MEYLRCIPFFDYEQVEMRGAIVETQYLGWVTDPNWALLARLDLALRLVWTIGSGSFSTEYAISA